MRSSSADIDGSEEVVKLGAITPLFGDEPDVFKTGQRVPESAWYQDQHGFVSFHHAHRTFPPCINRKGECAYRTKVRGLDAP